MAERESYAPGTPSWCDLSTSDVDGAARFYGGMFGWTAHDAGPDAGGYRMFTLRDKYVAGLGPNMAPGPSHWTTYVTVADADATTATARSAGATVHVEPMDVLDVGRMAIFADPTGAAIAVWQPRLHHGAQLVNEPNTMCWNELLTRDVDAAKTFYKKVFQWEVRSGGEYNEWLLGGDSIGGMMTMPPMVPAEVPAHWGVYFAVESCDGAVARASELGGSVMVGPMDIEPGRFATLSDPQGATFSVIALKADLAAAAG